jgi:hypothetical protein
LCERERESEMEGWRGKEGGEWPGQAAREKMNARGRRQQAKTKTDRETKRVAEKKITRERRGHEGGWGN